MLSTVDTMDVASPPPNASSNLRKTPKRLRSPDHVFTLGIEEELQIIDPETRELRSKIWTFPRGKLANNGTFLEGHVK